MYNIAMTICSTWNTSPICRSVPRGNRSPFGLSGLTGPTSSIENRQSSIPQCLARLQRVLNPLLRLLLSAQRFEPLALQVEHVLLADRRARGHVPAAEDLSDFGGQLHLVLGDVIALTHEVDAQLERSQDVLAGRGDVGARHGRLVAAAL